MESFDKSLFQANLEVYNFENKLYKKIRHVCTYPTERTDNKNHSNKYKRVKMTEVVNQPVNRSVHAYFEIGMQPANIGVHPHI